MNYISSIIQLKMIFPRNDINNFAMSHKQSPSNHNLLSTEKGFESPTQESNLKHKIKHKKLNYLKFHTPKCSYFSLKKNWDLDEAKSVYKLKQLNNSESQTIDKEDNKFDFHFYKEMFNKFHIKSNNVKTEPRKFSLFNPTRNNHNISNEHSKMTTYHTNKHKNEITQCKINKTSDNDNEANSHNPISDKVKNESIAEEPNLDQKKGLKLFDFKKGFKKIINSEIGEAKPKKFKKVLKSPLEVNNYLKTLNIPNEFVSINNNLVMSTGEASRYSSGQ